MSFYDISKEFDNRLLKICDEYMISFIKNSDLEDFIIQEEKWIKNNLTFIYSKEVFNIQLKINPYHQLIKYSIENEDAITTREYILLPKYLALKELHIHAGWLDKADLLIKVFINYANSFTYDEIIEKILNNSDPNRKDELYVRLQLMIRKFLSYQYMVID